MTRSSTPTDAELIRSIGTGRMDRAQITACLIELATRLNQQGTEAKILVIGGAALSLWYDRPQGTVDVDAWASPPGSVDSTVQAMSQQFGLRTDWFNQAASGFLPDEEIASEPTVQVGKVVIERAPVDLLLAMKLRACRPAKDGWDIAWLLRVCDVRSVEEAIAQLERFFPEEELPPGGTTLISALLREVTLPGTSPQLLPAIAPRVPSTSCGHWIINKDRRCGLPAGHDGDHRG